MKRSGLFFEVVRALRTNWLRTLLTMIGVIIGIAAVVVIMSLGATVSKTVEAELTKSGLNKLSITVNWKKLTASPLTDKTITTIREYRIPGIVDVNGDAQSYGSVTEPVSNVSLDSMLVGVNEKVSDMEALELLAGRMITADDISANDPVTVIDTLTVDKLFNGDITGSLGQKIENRGQYFKVVGVYTNNDSFRRVGRDLMPYTILMREPFNRSSYNSLSLTLDRTADLEDTRERLIAAFLLDKGAAKEEDLDVTISSPKKELSIFNNYMTGFSVIMALVAAISLVVGGVGIMNIMLVTVVERTREIGLMRALGAQKKHIVRQFVTESMIVTLLGGIVGVILGLLTTMLVVSVLNMLDNLPDFALAFSIPAVFVSLLVAAIIGITFGWYPAKKAADLDPVVALRHD